ncbi:hypothetical protein D9M72_491550 [compost metagenome]
MKTAGAKAFRRLPPFAPQPLQRWRDNQHHQRDLEIEIGKCQPEKRDDVEAGPVKIDAEPMAQQHGHETEAAECCDEGEGEWHTGKIRGDARESEDGIAQRARKATEGDGGSDQETEKTSKYRGQQAELDRNPEGRPYRGRQKLAKVLKRHLSLSVAERAKHDVESG